MNLSLKKRIAISFIIANLAVLVLSFVVFHFLHNLNTNIETITSKSMRISTLTNEVRLSTLQILKTQGVILVSKKPPISTLNRLRNKLKIIKNQLQNLELIDARSQGQKELSELLAYINSLEIVLKKSSSLHTNIIGLRKSIGDFFEKILNVFTKDLITKGKLTDITAASISRLDLALMIIKTYIKYPLPSPEIRFLPYNVCALPSLYPTTSYILKYFC